MNNLIRIPKTQNKSFKAWNAADELLILHSSVKSSKTLLFNDRFGYLSLHCKSKDPLIYITSKSQFESIEFNAAKSNETIDKAQFTFFPEKISKDITEVLISAPKSLELFRYFLFLAHSALTENGEVLIGFMTKHFSAKLLDICSELFVEVSQSKAQKKARVISLKKKKDIDTTLFLGLSSVQLESPSITLSQYVGNFSQNRIDKATLFLLENLKIKFENKIVLDIGSGNGIISAFLENTNKQNTFYLLDDSLISHLSGKLNLNGDNIVHHWEYNLDSYENDFFDIIITNPPFHFGHEIDFSIPFELLQTAIKKLKKGGDLVLVANNHINYPKLLTPLVSESTILNKNEKFYVYKVTK